MSDELDTILKTVADEARTGEALKTAKLVNLTFTVHALGDLRTNVIPAVPDKIVNGETVKGKPEKTTYSFLATISFDGEEPQLAWLSGVLLVPQLQALEAMGKLPCRLKLIKDEDNAYILVSGGQQPVTGSQMVEKAVAAAHAAQGPSSGKTPVERVLELFDVRRLSLDDLELANLVMTHGGGDALTSDPATTQVMLDHDKLAALPIPVIIGLIKALE